MLLALILTATLDQRLVESKQAQDSGDLISLLGTMAGNEFTDLEKGYQAKPESFLFVTAATLSAADTAELSGFKGDVMVVNKVKGLTTDGFMGLAKWPGKVLMLNGVESLSPLEAIALARWKGDRLFLDGVASLDAKTAAELAKWSGKMLSVRGLTNFPPDAIAAMKPFRGALGIKLDKRPTPPPVTGTLREQLIAMDRAITSGDVEAVRAFIAGGGDPNINEHGTSLLIEACDYKQVAIVAVLLDAKAKVDGETRDGETALTYALKVNEFDRRAVKDPQAITTLAIMLLAAKANPNPPNAYDPPLALAVKLGDAALVQRLIKAGAKVDFGGSNGHTPLLAAVNKENGAMVDLLLKAGAKPNPTHTGMGRNPFHQAFSGKDPKIVASLIKAGADLNALNDSGNTPLHLLARMEGDEATLIGLAKQMIAKGAKKGVLNQQKKTAAEVATAEKHEKLAAALR